MRYPDALRYLGGLGRFGMRLGLEPIGRLLGRLGDPHLAAPVVHVAGTVGKGSTSHGLASIFRAAGLRTGLYTSPHLCRFTERIRIGDTEITQDEAAARIEEVHAHTEEIPLTFFEVATAAAFLHFARQRADVAVVEVGLGGRLDATNVVQPLCSVITAVDLEHREHLGSTLGEIAAEKAGVIKGGRAVITGPLAPAAEAVVERIARERGAPRYSWERDFAAHREPPEGTGERFAYRGRRYRGQLWTPLLGGHQVTNAAVAACAAEVAAELGLPVSDRHLVEGLANLQVLGRFTEVRGEPPMVLDSAHNPVGARALAQALRGRYPHRPVALVFGVLADKDHLEMLRELSGLAAEVVAIRPQSHRGRDLADVVHAARELGMRATPATGWDEALARARAVAGASGVVVVTGSFYTVGEALDVLGLGGPPDPVSIGDPVRPLR